jgi:tetratricopeptide (TPR) repeat protein
MIFDYNPNSIGALIGRFVADLLFLPGALLGAWKCISISRRPATNAPCVLSLALFLMIFPIGVVANEMFHFNLASPLFLLVITILKWGMAAVSISVAIIGLAQCAHANGRFTQGRHQAIWAIVWSGLAMLVGMVVYFSPRPPINQPSKNQTIEFNYLNFRFSAPGPPWVRAIAKPLNADACLAFTRRSPEAAFIVIVEPLANTGTSTEDLADLEREKMQSASQSYHVVQKFPRPNGRLAGLEVQTEATAQDIPVFSVQWFCVTNGWAYQLAAWGKVTEREEVLKAAQEMTSRFDLVDFQMRPAPVTGSLTNDFTSTNLGFRVHATNSGWKTWPKLDANSPWSSFGMLHGEDAALTVTAVSLFNLKPEPEAVYRGLFALGNGTDELQNSHKIREQMLDGIEANFTRIPAGTNEFTYRFKALQDAKFAYLVQAWVVSQHPHPEKFLDEAMARVEFLPRSLSPPDPARFSAREIRAERMAINSIGLIYFNAQRYVESAPFFMQAVALGGLQTNEPYLENLTMAYRQSGHLAAALEELEKHPRYVDSQPKLAANRAFLQGRLGRVDSALTNYEKLFAAGFNDEDCFSDYIGLLSQENQTDKALAAIESRLPKQDSADLRLLQAALLKRTQKFDRAISLLQAQHEKNPFHAGLTLSLGDALIQGGRPSEALPLSEAMIRQSGTSAAAWSLKGRAQFALKWYREAKVSFENALKDAPSDTTARQYLQALAGILGEGSNAAIAEPLDPVPLPRELANPPPAPPSGFARDDGAYYSRVITAVSYQQGKECRRTDYFTAHVLSPTGVSAFSTFQISFNPLNEVLFVNEVAVKDSAGHPVSTGRAGDYYVLDDRSSSSANDQKVLNIPVAGLQPGFNLTVTITYRLLGPPKEFAFFPCAFFCGFPVQERALYYDGDTNAVHFASSDNLAPERVEQGLLWRQAQPPVSRWEPLRPRVADYVPMVWLNDAQARWPEIVTNYLASIQDRLELPPEQTALALRLASGSNTVNKKIAAIADCIQSNYTYKAIEFGRRARNPQAMAEVVRNKFGDCKDHAVLAMQMLKAAGIPSFLALLNTTGPVRQDLPSLDQFDHMIVCIPQPGADVFLDCTVKSFDLSSSCYGLAGREALILDGGHPHFERIPDYPTNSSVINLNRTVDLTNNTDALIRETVVFHGLHAGLYRSYFRAIPAASRRTYLVNLFVGVSEQLEDFKIDGLDDPRAPLTVKLTYLARGQFHSFEKEISGNAPVFFERSILLDQTVEKRTTPFEIPIPLTIEGATDIRSPSFFISAPPPHPASKVESRFVTGQLSSTADAAGCHLRYHLYEPAGRFAPEQYSSHNQTMQQAVDMLAARIVFAQKAK